MKKSISVGTKFGDLIVIEHIGVVNYQNTYLCECTCGNNREVYLTYLLNNKITHCGCKNFIKVHGNSKYDEIEGAFRAKASNYKSQAKNRGLDFDLSIETTVELLKSNCYYCNGFPSNTFQIKPQNKIKKPELNNIKYNGIDRLDNSKGYVKYNVVSCCNICNYAKLTLTLDEFKEWITKIYNNFCKNENNIY